MKPRILQFIGSFNQGGSERQAIALTGMLQDEGSYEVYAATLNKDGILAADVARMGLPPIPEFPLTSFYNSNFVRQVRLCARFMRENQIDILHTHDFYTNVFGSAAAILAGLQSRIASKRETGGMRSGSQEFVEKIAFDRAAGIVANSEAVRNHLIARGITSAKVSVIYNGIDLKRFSGPEPDEASFLQSLGLPSADGTRFITMVANLRHGVKNVAMLLRAARRIAGYDTTTHFVIAGEGSLRTELQATAQNLGVGDRVHFVGRCMNIPELLAASYVCVLTSSAEGFSNSILEYMAAERPVVATSVGGAVEAIIDGDTGYLVESDDDATLAQRLIELLDNEELARRFGRNGKRIVGEKFSCGAQLENTLELYNSTISRN